MSLATLALARLRARPLRAGATILGVAAVASLATAGLHLSAAGSDLAASRDGEPLVTMQAGRICPSTSHLPLDLGPRIAAVEGVGAVSSQLVVVNDCKVSTTATTFRGVEIGDFRSTVLPGFAVVDGSADGWPTAFDAALVGRQVAANQGLSVGDVVERAGVTFTVAAIVDGPRMQDRATVWVDRAVLEAAFPPLAGTATLFEVEPAAGYDHESVGASIDSLGADTSSAPFSVTAARVAGSLADMLQAGGLVALAAVAAAVLLVGNAAMLGLRGAARDLGILRAIGHPVRALAAVVGIEGAVTGLLGGLLGAVAAIVAVRWSAAAISTEGISVVIDARPSLVVLVVVGSLLAGLVAASLPGWWAARSGLRQILAGGG